MRRREPDTQVRKEELLSLATEISIKIGYFQLDRIYLAKMAHVSPGLISFYFKTIDNLKKEILKKAIKEEIYQIIAQAIVMNDEAASKIPKSLKNKTFHYLME